MVRRMMSPGSSYRYTSRSLTIAGTWPLHLWSGRNMDNGHVKRTRAPAVNPRRLGRVFSRFRPAAHRHWLRRYSVAVAAVIGAGYINWLLWDFIRPQGGPLFILAVVVSSWYGGLGPGLFAAVLATLARAVFYQEPIFDPLLEPQDLVLAPAFLFTAVLISSLVASRRAAEDELRQAHDKLEQRVEERTRELKAANEQLRQSIEDRQRVEEQRASLEASLRRADTLSAMGTLVAGVAHQVRNPLFGISSVLDAMEARLGQREEYHRYLSVLREQTDRLAGLMQELMAYGRPQAAEKHIGSIFDVLEDTARACRALAQKSNVELAVDVPPDMPQLPMDQAGLARVFENLVDNAIQSCAPGATVRMSAGIVDHEGANCVECRVEDEGRGISAEDLPRVFEPFFTRRRGGTGLGLAVAQRIVEDHRGSLTAENRPEGGALMIVRLPVVADAHCKVNESEGVFGQAPHSAGR
jgi:signal transduction histidine kinase